MERLHALVVQALVVDEDLVVLVDSVLGIEVQPGVVERPHVSHSNAERAVWPHRLAPARVGALPATEGTIEPDLNPYRLAKTSAYSRDHGSSASPEGELHLVLGQLEQAAGGDVEAGELFDEPHELEEAPVLIERSHVSLSGREDISTAAPRDQRCGLGLKEGTIDVA